MTRLLRTPEPYDGRGLLVFLAQRAVPGVEEVCGDTYRRAVGDGVLEVALTADGWELRSGTAAAARAVLDLDTDPAAVERALAPLASADPWTPGVRVPGTTDPHELAVRAVLGQQISVAAARTHAARLTAAHGVPLARPRGAVTHAFPTAAALAEADVGGLPRARVNTLRRLTTALAGGLDPRDRDALLALKGIGPWTADYVALRCGDRDAWLPTDLGVRHALARLDLAPADADAWRPFRAYAVLALWRTLSAR